MSAGIELPAYRSHKIVRAARIIGFRGNGNVDMPDLILADSDGRNYVVSVLPDWHAKHKPHPGGYYVVYEDGYMSFSPAKAFEEGYTRVWPAPTFQQRVIDEKADLDEKLAKLLAFFQTGTFDGLPEAERSRLRNQARFMDGYAAVLAERIAAFN